MRSISASVEAISDSILLDGKSEYNEREHIWSPFRGIIVGRVIA